MSLPRADRPKKFTERDERMILSESTSNPFKSSAEISATANEVLSDKQISSSFVRKLLFKKGIKAFVAKKKPFLTEKIKKGAWTGVGNIKICWKNFGAKSSRLMKQWFRCHLARTVGL